MKGSPSPLGCALAGVLALLCAALFGQVTSRLAVFALLRAGVTAQITYEVVLPAAWLLGFVFFLWICLRFYRVRARLAARTALPILFGDGGLALAGGVGPPAEIAYAAIDAVWLVGTPGGELQALVLRDSSGAPHAAPGGGVSYDDAARKLRERAGPTMLTRLRAMVDAGREVPFRARQGGAIVSRAGVRPAGAAAGNGSELAWAAVTEVREEPDRARVLGAGREIELPSDAENFVFFAPLASTLAAGPRPER